ncbi:MAG: exodeoxyribonuclease VII large subunit [Gammaproteobacteria bacterium]
MSEFVQKKNSNIISVTELNTSAKKLLERDFSSIWVTGEVSNFRSYDSGHWYFKVKDENSEIQCVMFKYRNNTINKRPVDGDNLILKGSISMYVARGTYQFQVDQIEYAGEGVLLKNFEELKNKLSKEGLFNSEHKKEIPRIVKNVAVITSPNGAVIEDIKNVLSRRSPLINVYLIPSLVQGEGSEINLLRSLEKILQLDKKTKIDVAIIARGGGSLEDLWSFNSEKLARRIFEFKIPVLSAIGHETDFTICDFVSDLRAPTPSSGAEIISEFYVGIFEELNSKKQLLKKEFLLKLSNLTNSLKLTSKSLVNPKTKLKEDFMKTDEMNNKLKYLLNSFISEKQFLIDKEKLSLKRLNPSDYVKTLKNNNLSLEKNLKTFIKNILNIKNENFKGSIKELEALSPLQILARGYSITKIKSSQKIIRDSKDINIGDIISSVVANSKIESKITKID